VDLLLAMGPWALKTPPTLRDYEPWITMGSKGKLTTIQLVGGVS
jgi:hypothetical protein